MKAIASRIPGRTPRDAKPQLQTKGLDWDRGDERWKLRIKGCASLGTRTGWRQCVQVILLLQVPTQFTQFTFLMYGDCLFEGCMCVCVCVYMFPPRARQPRSNHLRFAHVQNRQRSKSNEGKTRTVRPHTHTHTTNRSAAQNVGSSGQVRRISLGDAWSGWWCRWRQVLEKSWKCTVRFTG